ncbi:hypothetical protein ACFQXB_11630 [Plastorhodobacter daqingensis]|uniref:Integrase n=1 Tax=Plastorhodobacter daqingensis TaxID=1387281 RepID=A0ABW2UMS9_9RHOB
MDTYLLKKKATPREAKSLPGRKPKGIMPGEPREMYWDGDLHKVVAPKLPEIVVGGRVHMPTLSEATKLSAQTWYRAFNENKLSRRTANALLTLSRKHKREPGGLITNQDLLPFLLN